MAKVSYKIRSDKENGSINICISDNYRKIRLSTGIVIPLKIWDKKIGAFKLYGKYPSSEIQIYDILKNQLDQINKDVLELINEHGTIEKEDVKNIIAKSRGGDKETVIPHRMNEYLAYFIEQRKTGLVLTKEGERYTEGTLKSWYAFQSCWLEFQEVIYKRNLSFDEIDINVYSQFVNYMRDELEYTGETMRTRIAKLRALLNSADEHNLYDIKKSKHFSKTFNVASNKKPYLTEVELDKIFNLELADKMLSKVRDLFLIGCYTAQRVSDYSRISKDDIITLDDGSLGLSMYQKKTSHKINIPFINEDRAKTILERWDYNLPSLGKNPDILVNRHIKVICKMAGITDAHIVETIKSGEVIKTKVEKCDLITSHTARRTALTILYKQGMLTIGELMYMSGHKSEKTFMGYISLSSNEQATIIAKKINNE